jgi:hypothetical protein
MSLSHRQHSSFQISNVDREIDYSKSCFWWFSSVASGRSKEVLIIGQQTFKYILSVTLQLDAIIYEALVAVVSKYVHIKTMYVDRKRVQANSCNY